MTGVVSEAWEDLGYRDKPAKDSSNPYRHFKPIPKHIHETPAETEARKRKNIEIIDGLKEIAENHQENDGFILLKIKGKSFEFWPATDCWFSHAKNSYGTGIRYLADLIRQKLSPV